MALFTRSAAALLLALVSIAAGAQPRFFGDYAPLTNTRYGSIGGAPELIANGKDVLLFWTAMNNVRATRLADGQFRVSQVVLETFANDMAVTWTGQHFLVAATNDPAKRVIVGRLLDGTGTPVSEQFTLRNEAISPRLASNGSRIVMLYTSIASAGVRAAILSADGRELIADLALGTSAVIGDYDIASNGRGFSVISSNAAAVRITTLDANGAIVSTTTVDGASSSDLTREVAIASNGDNYLAVWTANRDGIHAATVSAAGTAANSVTLEMVGVAGAPDVTWSGDHYEVAYRSLGPTTEVRALTIRNGSPAVINISHSLSNAFSRVAVAYLDGRTRLAWSATDLGVINVRDTDDTGDGLPASFGAADQQLVTTATSANATLFVWNEIADEVSRVYAGVRAANGNWDERQIALNLGPAAVAASNGNEFMVVASDDKDWLAYRLSAAGALVGPPTRITSRANIIFNDMTWNGTEYVLAGVDGQGRIAAAKLSMGSSLSALTVVRSPRQGFDLEQPAVASDGTNTLLAWREIQPISCFPICDFAIDGINYQLLGPDLQLLGDSAHQLVDNDAGEPHLVWTGSEYVAIWAQAVSFTVSDASQEIRGAKISRNGLRVDPIYTIATTGAPVELQVRPVRQNIAIAWRQTVPGDIRALEARVMLVQADGRVLSTTSLGKKITTSTLLAVLPDARVAHVVASRQIDAPYHGASRILLAIGNSIAPPARPGAPPRLTAVIDGSTATLSWTRPPGDVNGYRIEYRVGDGAWNEIDRWLGPNETTTNVRLARTGGSTVFRIRAWNDAGLGGYSPVSGSGSPRRRAVR